MVSHKARRPISNVEQGSPAAAAAPQGATTHKPMSVENQNPRPGRVQRRVRPGMLPPAWAVPVIQPTPPPERQPDAHPQQTQGRMRPDLAARGDHGLPQDDESALPLEPVAERHLL